MCCAGNVSSFEAWTNMAFDIKAMLLGARIDPLQLVFADVD